MDGRRVFVYVESLENFCQEEGRRRRVLYGWLQWCATSFCDFLDYPLVSAQPLTIHSLNYVLQQMSLFNLTHRVWNIVLDSYLLVFAHLHDILMWFLTMPPPMTWNICSEVNYRGIEGRSVARRKFERTLHPSRFLAPKNASKIPQRATLTLILNHWTYIFYFTMTSFVGYFRFMNGSWTIHERHNTPVHSASAEAPPPHSSEFIFRALCI